MKAINALLIVSATLIINEVNCGVIDYVSDKVSNTTKAVKDDVQSWWSYGVGTIIGLADDNQYVRSINNNALNAVNKTEAVVKEQSGIISGVYNKFRGGVSSGYMKVHDVVLGEDSDPNKGIIRTLYERAKQRLSQVKSYVFGNVNAIDQRSIQGNDDNERNEVLKAIFGNNTGLFNGESEKKALDSLRNKLTEVGDNTLQLADNERKIIRKAYDSVRHKGDEINIDIRQSADVVKNNLLENINKTQEFIRDASSKAQDGAHSFGENVQKSVGGVII